MRLFESKSLRLKLFKLGQLIRLKNDKTNTIYEILSKDSPYGIGLKNTTTSASSFINGNLEAFAVTK